MLIDAESTPRGRRHHLVIGSRRSLADSCARATKCRLSCWFCSRKPVETLGSDVNCARRADRCLDGHGSHHTGAEFDRRAVPISATAMKSVLTSRRTGARGSRPTCWWASAERDVLRDNDCLARRQTSDTPPVAVQYDAWRTIKLGEAPPATTARRHRDARRVRFVPPLTATTARRQLVGLALRPFFDDIAHRAD